MKSILSEPAKQRSPQTLNKIASYLIEYPDIIKFCDSLELGQIDLNSNSEPVKFLLNVIC
jgi:hypothetical protein